MPHDDSTPDTVSWRVTLEAKDGDSTVPPPYLGRYRIKRLLGSGGFGRVYAAEDELLKRAVAIKVALPKFVSAADDVERFLTEARILGSLDHPNIVPVWDCGQTEEGVCFVVAKLIEGHDLAHLLRGNTLATAEALGWISLIARALHYAHQRGVVHRDVKPANMLIERATRRPYLADFGLALREQDVPRARELAGTPAYMSPEQARGEGHRVDGRSDIFNLGVVLYEVLTRRRPFVGKSWDEICEKIQRAEPRPLRQIDDTIPRSLERICLKALAPRTSDRYLTALDMAEDLDAVVPRRDTRVDRAPSPTEPLAPDTADKAGDTSTLAAADDAPSPSSGIVRIVPKGLRSFDARDADFFGSLLPGPRDRHGCPESIRFWRESITDEETSAACPVGLIYGPSGCGKTSFLRAGLLPQLPDHVRQLYVECTARDAVASLRSMLQQQFPRLSDEQGLPQLLSRVRRGDGPGDGEKLLLVFDQFEQLLHAAPPSGNTELTAALRQCDGRRVQCLILVRDDFWMAITRFFHELDIELVQGVNVAAVDLFGVRHARKVLVALGRAYGALPEAEDELSPDHHAFLDRAVDQLAEDDRVICVRLAMFAEMVKQREWEPATLQALGGPEGIGVTFLEETFSSRWANPKHRLHEPAARRVLQTLLPPPGSDIRGHHQPTATLARASGYQQHSSDFRELLHCLDQELRLITPHDPKPLAEFGPDDDPPARAVPVANEQPAEHGNGNRAGAPGGDYQLTHDYLVVPIRRWLTLKRLATWRGRAELRLAERADLWAAKQETRLLPSLWEVAIIQLLTRRGDWSATQRDMMSRATRRAVFRGATAVLLVLLGLVLIQQYRVRQQRARAETLVNAMISAPSRAVPYALDNVHQAGSTSFAVLQDRFRAPGTGAVEKLRAAYGLAAFGVVQEDFLLDQVMQADPAESPNLLAALQRCRDRAVRQLNEQFAATDDPKCLSRTANTLLLLGDSEAAKALTRVQEDPFQRCLFIEGFREWCGDLCSLAGLLQKPQDASLRSALVLAIGTVPDVGAREREVLIPVLQQLLRATSDPATHSAASWTLRQWRVEHDLPPATPPVTTRPWWVNSEGMTMLRIQPGCFVRYRNLLPEEEERQEVELSAPYYLASTEVTVAQFQRFVDDTDWPSANKPQNWDGPVRKVSRADDCPVQNVSWIDAVQYCNWLSHREQRTPCYERGGVPVDAPASGNWRLDRTADGYRLPTEAEWEYACRAGTTTDYCCGNGEFFLPNYAVYYSMEMQPVASRLPNAWGLFDMHGNAAEWCHDWGEPYPEDRQLVDPFGPSSGVKRAIRGGNFALSASVVAAAARAKAEPAVRNLSVGFRVLQPAGN